jgi:hypothetical protein
MTTAPAKICYICHQDCSRKPRAKDGQGRYACEACLAQKKAEAALRAGAEPAPGPERKPAAKRPPTAPAAATRPPAAPPKEDELPAGFWDAPSTTPVAPPVIKKQCDKCGAAMAPGAVVCMSCGFNTQNRSRVRTRVGKAQDDIPRKTRRGGGGGAWAGLAITVLAYGALGIAGGIHPLLVGLSMLVILMTLVVALAMLIVGAFRQGHTLWGLLIIGAFIANLAMSFHTVMGGQPNPILGLILSCTYLAILIYTFVINQYFTVKILYAACFVGLVSTIVSLAISHPEVLRADRSGASRGVPTQGFK